MLSILAFYVGNGHSVYIVLSDAVYPCLNVMLSSVSATINATMESFSPAIATVRIIRIIGFFESLS